MSVAWFTRLYRLNEAGQFDEAIALSAKFLAQRPKDYALHLQRAKALLSTGRFDDASSHLDAAITLTKRLAAWPWFYQAALCARRGQRAPMFEAMSAALRIDPRLWPEFATSPFFAAFWTSLAPIAFA